jgi:hypothetical protein
MITFGYGFEVLVMIFWRSREVVHDRIFRGFFTFTPIFGYSIEVLVIVVIQILLIRGF